MSSFALFSTAAARRPVAGTQQAASLRKIRVETLLATSLSAMPKLAGVVPASRLEVRPMPEMVSSGIREINALTGGIPRGCLTEVCGAASSGRTSVLLATLAAATQRQEVCALVDASDTFHPLSAAVAGVNFERLLWVRCGMHMRKSGSPQSRPSTTPRAGSDTESKKYHRQMASPVEQALRVTDLLLQSGGFGLVMIDLGDVSLKIARRIPLASWFRFQRAVERTPTVLFVVTQAPCAQTCAALLLKVQKQLSVPSLCSGQAKNSFPSLAKKLAAASSQLSEKDLAGKISPTHAQLLDELHIEGELLRSRLERKPVRSVTAAFTTKALRIS